MESYKMDVLMSHTVFIIYVKDVTKITQATSAYFDQHNCLSLFNLFFRLFFSPILRLLYLCLYFSAYFLYRFLFFVFVWVNHMVLYVSADFTFFVNCAARITLVVSAYSVLQNCILWKEDIVSLAYFVYIIFTFFIFIYLVHWMLCVLFFVMPILSVCCFVLLLRSLGILLPALPFVLFYFILFYFSIFYIFVFVYFLFCFDVLFCFKCFSPAILPTAAFLCLSQPLIYFILFYFSFYFFYFFLFFLIFSFFLYFFFACLAYPTLSAVTRILVWFCLYLCDICLCFCLVCNQFCYRILLLLICYFVLGSNT